MNISIIIPSWNNKKYLQKCIESIQLNSFFKHEIIVHLNEGTDGSKDYLDKIDIKYSKSNINIGICSAVNLAYKKTNNNYILYSNDDMYFAKNWDKKLDNEISELNHNFFYITAKTIS